MFAQANLVVLSCIAATIPCLIAISGDLTVPLGVGKACRFVCRPIKLLHSLCAVKVFPHITPNPGTKPHDRRTSAVQAVLLILLMLFTLLWMLLLPDHNRSIILLSVLMHIAVVWPLLTCEDHSFNILKTASHSNSPRIGTMTRQRRPQVAYVIALEWMCLLPSILFFGSGHFSEFAGVQWTAAVVGFNSVQLLRSAAFVYVNTFGHCVISCLTAALLALWGQHAWDSHWFSTEKQSYTPCSGAISNSKCIIVPEITALKDCRGTRHGAPSHVVRGFNRIASVKHMDVQRLQSASILRRAQCCILLLTCISCLNMCFASMCVMLHRRHLLIWALFTPKWMFEVFNWFTTSGFSCMLCFFIDLWCSLTLVVNNRTLESLAP